MTLVSNVEQRVPVRRPGRDRVARVRGSGAAVRGPLARGRLMEPRIQYAKTEDGVSIAYWTLGDGKLLVSMPAGLAGHSSCGGT